MSRGCMSDVEEMQMTPNEIQCLMDMIELSPNKALGICGRMLVDLSCKLATKGQFIELMNSLIDKWEHHE